MSAPAETIRLEKAAFIRGRFVREVTMRPVTQDEVDEAWAAFDDPGERGLFLVARACNLPESAVRKMGDANQALLAARFESANQALLAAGMDGAHS